MKDSSIHDSMTRWITIHGTQDVTIARNVGYLSIGHGYYLEDGTETDNQFYSNLGIFARAAVANSQNPRRIPGILTTNDRDCKNGKGCASGYDNLPFYSDSNHPAVFWIMNGANQFKYNMAAGAGTCGACYWFVPGAISGRSRLEKWFGYASEQQGLARAGTTPLASFVGNYCSSAAIAFMEVGDTFTCNGVNFMDPNTVKPGSTLLMLPSDDAKQNNPPKNPDLFWPQIGGGGRLATRCADADAGKSHAECSTVPLCSNGKNEANCDVTVLDRFTTSFNFPEQNFAAIWMRPFWSLLVNSFISDVQNAGLNFVTSGDFSKASVIDGFWALARKSAFVGSTQWLNPSSTLSDNPLASNAGPVNPFKSKDGIVKGLTCALEPNGGLYNPLYCLPIDADGTSEGVVFRQNNWGVSQRFFSVYDGPTYQDSNVYLNILPTYLTDDGTVNGKILQTKAGPCKPDKNVQNPCAAANFMNSFLPGVKADQLNGKCYLPNAAIGWKQPNGFYYAPAFHSTNLFFDRVGIRHLVTEPFFKPGLFDFETNVDETKEHYCYWTSDVFRGFTDIDRETVLNDDDGTLTGLTSPVNQPTIPKTETISVNTENFFNAPTETPECASDLALNRDGPNQTGDAKCPPNTAKTSPYEYVTTALYPECALDVPEPPPPPAPQPLFTKCEPDNKYIWGSACSQSPPEPGGCVGIPMYRQLLTTKEVVGLKQVKRMMGQNTFQRSALTVNHGVYYIDTTVSTQTQQNAKAQSINVFAADQKYDIFFVYANKRTTQTYQLFVGKDIPQTGGKDFGQTNVKFGYVDISTKKYKFGLATPPGNNKQPGDLPDEWGSKYDSKSGILTLATNMKSLTDDFDITKNNLGMNRCRPATMCTWDHNANQCGCNPDNPYYDTCKQTNPAGQTVCSWSVKDIDCPDKGCPSFQIRFPDKKYFEAINQNARPIPSDYNFANIGGFDWNIGFNLENEGISGKECTYPQPGPPLKCSQ